MRALPVARRNQRGLDAADGLEVRATNHTKHADEWWKGLWWGESASLAAVVMVVIMAGFFVVAATANMWLSAVLFYALNKTAWLSLIYAVVLTGACSAAGVAAAMLLGIHHPPEAIGKMRASTRNTIAVCLLAVPVLAMALLLPIAPYRSADQLATNVLTAREQLSADKPLGDQPTIDADRNRIKQLEQQEEHAGTVDKTMAAIFPISEAIFATPGLMALEMALIAGLHGQAGRLRRKAARINAGVQRAEDDFEQEQVRDLTEAGRAPGDYPELAAGLNQRQDPDDGDDGADPPASDQVIPGEVVPPAEPQEPHDAGDERQAPGGGGNTVRATVPGPGPAAQARASGGAPVTRQADSASPPENPLVDVDPDDIIV